MTLEDWCHKRWLKPGCRVSIRTRIKKEISAWSDVIRGVVRWGHHQKSLLTQTGNLARSCWRLFCLGLPLWIPRVSNRSDLVKFHIFKFSSSGIWNGRWATWNPATVPLVYRWGCQLWHPIFCRSHQEQAVNPADSRPSSMPIWLPNLPGTSLG